jgi:hypothetical protein
VTEAISAAARTLLELVEAKRAHEEACRQWGIDNPPRPLNDWRGHCTSVIAVNAVPLTRSAIDVAVERLDAAWEAAKRFFPPPACSPCNPEEMKSE